MDEKMIALLRGLRGTSIQDSVANLVNDLMKTHKDYKPTDKPVECQVKAGSVSVKVGLVERTAVIPIQDFGIQLDKVNKEDLMYSLINWEGIDQTSPLIMCIKSLEANVIELLAKYLISFTAVEYNIDEPLLKLHARIEEYIDNSRAFYQERIRIMMVVNYDLIGYMPSEDMEQMKRSFFTNWRKQSVRSTLLTSDKRLAHQVERRMQFDVKQYVAHRVLKNAAAEIALHSDVWALCMDYTLRQMPGGKHYRFSISMDKQKIKRRTTTTLSVWINDPLQREAVFKLCKYPEGVKNISCFLSHPEDMREPFAPNGYYTYQKDDGEMPKNLLNIKEWVYKGTLLFCKMLDIAEQYLTGSSCNPDQIRDSMIVLFILTRCQFQYKDYMKIRYELEDDDLFMYQPVGFWRPHSTKRQLVEEWKKWFFKHGAINLGRNIMMGCGRPYSNRVIEVMKVVDDNSIRDCFPPLVERLRDHLDYSMDNTEILLSVFSLVRHFCNPGESRPFPLVVKIDEIIQPCLTHLGNVFLYLRRFRADLQEDLYNDDKKFNAKWVFRAFVHASGAFSNYPNLMKLLYEAYEYTQLNLMTDILIDSGTWAFPLTPTEKHRAMLLISLRIADEDPEGPREVHKSGHIISEFLQTCFNKCRVDYFVTIFPGSRRLAVR